ncbi:hypothetical protein ACAF95_28105, partial [Escherichia coli]
WAKRSLIPPLTISFSAITPSTREPVEIKDRAFFANPVLTGAVDKAKKAGKAVHIMGLLSAGGVHSHDDHIMAMVELA